jgi:DNA repair ATPase RecN
MSADSPPYTGKKAPTIRHWRRGLAIAFLLVLILSIWLALLLHDKEPNYYQPARAALVGAHHRLNEYYSHESIIIQQLREAKVELDAALSMVAKAENLDPADKQLLDELSQRLRHLDDIKQATRMTPALLQNSYRAIAEQLDELIHRLELPKR